MLASVTSTRGSLTLALHIFNNDAAYFFDPDNISEIKSSMKEILINQNLRKDLIERGKSHYKKFNWKTTVDKTFELINY